MNLRREPAFPQRLKPASFAALAARLKGFRGNYAWRGKRPSGAKAGVDFMALTARLKTAPFQNSVTDRVFPQPLKLCPSQNHLVGKF